MANWYATFPMRYNAERHPVFGDIPNLADKLWKFSAADADQARKKLVEVCGKHWSDLYSEDEYRAFKRLYTGGVFTSATLLPPTLEWIVVTAKMSDGRIIENVVNGAESVSLDLEYEEGPDFLDRVTLPTECSQIKFTVNHPRRSEDGGFLTSKVFDNLGAWLEYRHDPSRDDN